MEKNDWSNVLGRVQHVDPPPFLFTRIQARVEARVADVPSRAWVASLAMAMLLLLFVNSYLFTAQRSEGQGVEQVATSMGMSTSNQLYHE